MQDNFIQFFSGEFWTDSVPTAFIAMLALLLALVVLVGVGIIIWLATATFGPGLLIGLGVFLTAVITMAILFRYFGV